MRIIKPAVLPGLATIAVAAMSIMSSPPAAAADYDTASRVVDVRGLDLSAPSDQAILRHRLLVSASAVCSREGSGGLQDDAYLECRKVAFVAAWSQARTLMAAATSRSLMAAGPAPARTQPGSLIASASKPGSLPGR